MAKLVCHGEKYTKGAVAKIERHNERLNEHYSNQDIDLEINVTPDLIAALESYGYTVIRPGEKRDKNGD